MDAAGERRVVVPLSPEEQKILQDIEKSFYEHDPQFSRKVSETTIYRVAGRNLKWLAIGFVAAFVFMIWSFTTNLLLGLVGFLAMLACAFFFERNLRKMGKAGLESLTSTMRGGGGLSGRLNNASKKARDRFKRDN
jgi:FtsH-binding integral membrane protein